MPQPPDPIIARAKEADALLRKLRDQGLMRPETVEDWVELGRELWGHSYEGGASDSQAFSRMLKWADYEADTKPTYGNMARRAGLATPAEQVKYLWAARWADQGCPKIVVDPKYAALLISTDVTKAAFEHVIPPWKAFFIELPSDLITIDSDDGTLDPVQRIVFQEAEGEDGTRQCNFIGYGSKMSVWRHNIPLIELATHLENDSQIEWNDIEITGRDDRAIRLIGRLILSTCVAMMDSSNYHRQKATKGRGERKRQARGLPELQTFVLGKPVSVNCRPSILEYLSGTGKTKKGLTVQFMVRGHWKHQAHGPGHSLRKFIHIEPYWKGPEDGKILTRHLKLEEV